MTNPYPLPRETRETGELVGDGSATYGPFSFKIWNTSDVYLEVARDGGAFVDEAVVVNKTSGAAFDTFTITADPALTASDLFRVRSERLHERSTSITRGSRLDTPALEAELSKIGTVLQELRRDSDRLGLANETAARIAADLAEQQARIAADDEEADARIAADLAEQQARIAAVQAEADARIAAVQNEAAAREAADDALASLIAQSGGGTSFDFDTLDALGLAEIPEGRQSVTVAGYSVADGRGAGPYRRVAAEPSHSAKKQSADGAWWEYAGARITPYHLGALGDDSAGGDGNALQLTDQAAVALKIPTVITWGTFRCGSPVTFNSEVFFEGGILKPDNTIDLTFNNSLYALPFRIFDTSLGGRILGSPKLPSNSVWSEWWGANPVGDCTTAILAAVAFLKQRVISGSLGGTLQGEQGDYGLSQTVTIDFRACKILGRGDWLSAFYGTGGILLFNIVGHIDGSKASYGFEFIGWSVRGDNTNPKPTAGKIMKLFECQQFTIENNTFLNIYQGIEYISCEGPLEKQMGKNTWIAPNTKPAISGSYLWYVTGIDPSDPRVTTGICHSIKIIGNRGGGIGIQYGAIYDAFDQVTSLANHIWGCDQACANFTSNGHDGYNFFSLGDTYEAINGGAAYAVLVASSQASLLNALTFAAGQMLNGSQCMFYVTGTAPKNVKLLGYDMRQAISNCILLEGGTDLLVADTSAIDIDINSTAGEKFFCIVGNGGVGPAGAIIDNLTTQISDFAGLAAAAIDLRVGTNIKVRGGRLRGAYDKIRMVGGLGVEVEIGEDVDTGLRTPSIASATTIVPLLGTRVQKVTGTTTVGNIALQSSHRGRRLMLRIDNGLTVQHSGGGNLRLATAANWAAPAGSWIHFECSIDTGEWIETGRNVA